jgi:hypothetical protein
METRSLGLPKATAERHEPREKGGPGSPPRESNVPKPNARQTVRRQEQASQRGQSDHDPAASRKGAATAPEELAAGVAAGAGSGLGHRRPRASSATGVNR